MVYLLRDPICSGTHHVLLQSNTTLDDALANSVNDNTPPDFERLQELRTCIMVPSLLPNSASVLLSFPPVKLNNKYDSTVGICVHTNKVLYSQERNLFSRAIDLELSGFPTLGKLASIIIYGPRAAKRVRSPTGVRIFALAGTSLAANTGKACSICKLQKFNLQHTAKFTSVCSVVLYQCTHYLYMIYHQYKLL